MPMTVSRGDRAGGGPNCCTAATSNSSANNCAVCGASADTALSKTFGHCRRHDRGGGKR